MAMTQEQETDLPNATVPQAGEKSPEPDQGALGDAIAAMRPEHPALARAHDQLRGQDESTEITSYDRLHHRHNRS
jgi:hypothetical protein